MRGELMLGGQETGATPNLMQVEDIMAALRCTRQRALKIVRTMLPMGGVLRFGNKYLVHAWCFNKYLQSITITKLGQEEKRQRSRERCLERLRASNLRWGKPFPPAPGEEMVDSPTELSIVNPEGAP